MTKKRIQKILIYLTLSFAGLFLLSENPDKIAAASVVKNASTPAIATITAQTAVEGIEPIGVNLGTITGGTNFGTNNFIWGSGMEPAMERYIVRVERSGPGWIEWSESLGGIHMWDQNASGFGDGASVRIYRIVDAAGKPLSYSGKTELENSDGANHVVFLGDTTVPVGGWKAEGSKSKNNRVSFSDKSLTCFFGDYALINVKKLVLAKKEVNSRLYEWYSNNNGSFWLPEGATSVLVKHPGTLPATFKEPGESCMQITLPSGKGGWIGQYLFHPLDSGEGQWYSQLEPLASYKASIWLRQEGIAKGQVKFSCTGPYSDLTQSDSWSVTGEWAEYTYEFQGPPYPQDGSHAGFGIEASGPGKIWMDNFVVYRNDAFHQFRPFTPNIVSFKELMAALPPTGIKPAVRFYPLCYAGQSSVERLLSNYGNSRIDFIYNINAPQSAATIPQILEYALATGTKAADRVIPWITLSEEFNENDWKAIVEYLGVPYDPKKDTPITKPWAYLRFTQRGTGQPWTDEFREIPLEFGNETWHQGAGGYGWNGFGRPNWVHWGGTEYGMFANFFWKETVMKSPFWSEYKLGQKIKFILNANYSAETDSYGEAAAQQVPGVPLYLGHANYTGAKWETGEEPHQAFNAHGIQETLIAGWTDMFDLIDQAERTQKQFSSQGKTSYGIVAYEGGPSGYYVPGQGTEQQTAVSQLYGKSLAAGVSALDTWLYSSLHGYKHQGFFAFCSGENWTSHTMPQAGGFGRQTGWLALMLRNLYAPGDRMLKVEYKSLPGYVRSGEKIPLISIYAIKDESTLSVFVLSKKLAGKHDGDDFGNGTTPVTINLPSKNFSSVIRYALTKPDGTPADPAANNIDAENVAITRTQIDPKSCTSGQLVIGSQTGGVEGGMPGGTVYLYVFKLK